MAIPYDFNPVGKAAGTKAKTSTIWEITTTGANNTYSFRLLDYQGETNIIDWGDGTIAQSSSNTDYTNYTHTYTNAGTYTISVLGNHVNIQLGAMDSTYGKYVSKVIQLCDSLIEYVNLFCQCTNLTTQMLPEDFTVPEGITRTEEMFRNTKITSLPDGFTFPNSVTSFYRIFQGCSNLISLPNGVTIPNSVTSCNKMFYGCSNLTSLPEGFTIPNSVTNCQYMFYQCSNLTSLPEGFTIPNSVTNCQHIFNNCKKLTSLPDGVTIPNSVTSCNKMFYRCSNLTSLPDGFTIPNSVTNCDGMFYQCLNLTSLPDGFTIPNSVTNCASMFQYCQKLISLPDGFTIPNSVTNCNSMFYYCQKLISLPDGFTIPNSVTNCNSMFYNCLKLVYDISILLSKWTAKTRNVQSCFYYCGKITGQAPANVLWNVQSITSYSNCFTSCTSLSNYYSIPYSWGGRCCTNGRSKFFGY